MTTTGQKVQDLPNKWRSTHCFLLFIYCCGRRYVRYKRVRWSGDPCQKYLSLLWSFCGSALNDKRGQTDGRVGGAVAESLKFMTVICCQKERWQNIKTTGFLHVPSDGCWCFVCELVSVVTAEALNLVNELGSIIRVDSPLFWVKGVPGRYIYPISSLMNINSRITDRRHFFVRERRALQDQQTRPHLLWKFHPIQLWSYTTKK